MYNLKNSFTVHDRTPIERSHTVRVFWLFWRKGFNK